MPSVNVRLSDDLHAELVAAAGRAGRSLQREIIVRLDGRVPVELPVRVGRVGERLPGFPDGSYPEGSDAITVEPFEEAP